MNEAQAVAKCVSALAPNVKKSTVYLSDKLVVSVCRRFKFSKRNTRDDFVMKIGTPNYLERNFISRCKRVGEPLPVKKVQIKFWPEKKK